MNINKLINDSMKKKIPASSQMGKVRNPQISTHSQIPYILGYAKLYIIVKYNNKPT